MTVDLHGKVALVTGSSSGIGAAIGRRLGSLGASVVLVARRGPSLRTVADEITDAGGYAITLSADVSNLDSVRHAINQTLTKCERLDIVVANAGTASLDSFGGSEPGSWQHMIDTNLSGTINTAHAALPALLDSAATYGVADFVAVSSVVGRAVPSKGGVYSATKFAVNAFSESLRKEVGERSVRVSLVEPGFVETPLTTGIASRLGYSLLSPEDVADAVEFIIGRPAGTAVNEVLLRATHEVA